MHHSLPNLSIVSAQPVPSMITLVLKEIVKNFIIVDKLKAALSGCSLDKKLEGFLQCLFNFVISRSCHPGGLRLSLTLKPSACLLLDPHCCFCLVFLAFSSRSVLAVVRSGSGTISTNSLNA